MTTYNNTLNLASKLALDWAKEVGKIQLSYFRGNNLDINTKSNVSDVVTIVDKECEAYLISKIQKHFPTHAILGEENGEVLGSSDYLWIVDPLDGTNNFSQGLPIFAVSIGLQYKNETILGIVFAPYINEMFIAIKGEGSYLNGKKIEVSKKSKLETSVLATGFPYDKGTNPDNNLENLNKILPQIRGIRRMGAAAYDLACVAAGYFDGYWELSLGAWDMCAGALLVEEAGGEIYHFRKDRGISIIAGNREIVTTLKTLVK